MNGRTIPLRASAQAVLPAALQGRRSPPAKGPKDQRSCCQLLCQLLPLDDPARRPQQNDAHETEPQSKRRKRMEAIQYWHLAYSTARGSIGGPRGFSWDQVGSSLVCNAMSKCIEAERRDPGGAANGCYGPKGSKGSRWGKRISGNDD